MSTAVSSVSAVLEVDNEALNGESYYLSWCLSAAMVPTPLSMKWAKGVKSIGLVTILFEVVSMATIHRFTVFVP